MLDIMAIPLTRGLYAVVDGADYERLNKWKWCALRGKNTFYAVRKVKRGKKWAALFMHRTLLDLGFGNKLQGDHRNHNGLDNRKSNLRVCTSAQNHQNRLPIKNASSKFKGVAWDKQKKKWRARIQINGKNIELGRFNFETEAALAYDKTAKRLFGEFACTNFPYVARL